MLPKLSIPEFTTTIPSTKKKIKFRPFLVREEKILLIALEDGEKETIARAIIELLKNCILNTEIKVEELPKFDIEYLFMQVRAKSVGESIDMLVRHGSGDCKAKTKITLNIDDIKILGKISDGKIAITEQVGVKLRYPTYERTINGEERTAVSLFENVVDNVEYVYDAETVYNEFSKEELEEWLNNLNKDQFDKILDFFMREPKLSHTIEWTCKECGKKDYAIVEGLKGFFMLA